MHKTLLPLRTWLRAIWYMAVASRGMSATGLAVRLGIATRTAWSLHRRVRAMIAADDPVVKAIVRLDRDNTPTPIRPDSPTPQASPAAAAVPVFLPDGPQRFS